MILAGLFLLRGYCRTPRGVYFVGGILCGVGIGRAILNTDYLARYTPQDAAYLPNAYTQYLPLRILGVAEAILMLLLLLLVMHGLMGMIREYTEINYGRGSEELSRSATERMRRALSKKGRRTLVLLVLSALCKSAEAWLSHQYPMLWLLQVAVSALAITAFWGFLLELFEQIKEKYDCATYNP